MRTAGVNAISLIASTGPLSESAATGRSPGSSMGAASTRETELCFLRGRMPLPRSATAQARHEGP